MTFEEQQLIAHVFDRFRGSPPMAKDTDAERLIQEQFDRVPDAPYRLVQSVVVQEKALQRLEDRLRQLETLVADVRPDQAARAGFLPDETGAGPSRIASVPQTGPRYAAEPPPLPREAPSSPGGGFLASALTTASGVAGGILLTDGLKELFGGGRSNGFSTETSSWRTDQSALDRAQDDAQDAREDADNARAQLTSDDAALDDAQDGLEASADSAWDFGET